MKDRARASEWTRLEGNGEWLKMRETMESPPTGVVSNTAQLQWS